MPFRSLILPAVLAGLPLSALADPALECGGGSQVETGDCLARMEQVADVAMATAFGFALRSAEDLDAATGRAAAAPALRTAQEAWAAYREAHCAAVGAGFGGGSGTGIAIRSCRIDLARERANALMRLAQ